MGKASDLKQKMISTIKTNTIKCSFSPFLLSKNRKLWGHLHVPSSFSSHCSLEQRFSCACIMRRLKARCLHYRLAITRTLFMGSVLWCTIVVHYTESHSFAPCQHSDYL